MSNRVFVLNPDKSPLMPCTAKRARKMLEAGRAAVFRRYPFTIILKSESPRQSQPLALKLDPGSKTTGMALVMEGKTGRKCIWGAELAHRGLAIKLKLQARRALRASRRSRKLRHRPARFQNRTKPAGWLPPSLMHRVLTVVSWARRLERWTPLDSFSMELVSFDMQKMLNPDIQRDEYQKGTLFGAEIRAYLRQKWDDKCAYCGKKGEEVEHLIPRSQGGTNRVSNLVWSCRSCNEQKGSLTLEEFLAKKPAALRKIQEQQSASLHDAAAVNATKYRLLEELKAFGYPVETGSGAQTSFNRTQQGYDKAHWIDAACVGDSGASVAIRPLKPLKITCMGRGNRQMCGTDKYGFPVRHRTRQKVFFGFQTGDIVRAVVPSGKYAGRHTGRIAVRAKPNFKLGTFDVHVKYLIALQRADGYGYNF
ncbi:RNA-guided endonuclease IscB [Deinococcus sp. S9]|uniref:RNA-guided endonuclease IscB n=1 Tax=Deinococcus sp. S9 TaxID=2545754 RepID=UPI0010565EDF|nr:RNA-guided endonuclease IscB [Deinococcus sp. S9]TDE87344.1 HNH endonuclease [Deinococcus sp. S9]